MKNDLCTSVETQFATLINQLTKSYDLHLTRRQNLEHRAQQLLSFLAIIGTLLFSFLLVAIANKDKLDLLLNHPLFPYVQLMYYSISISYLLGLILSLIILLIPKWIPPPVSRQDLTNLKHKNFNPADYNLRLAFGLKQGIEQFTSQNALKYLLLRIALTALMLGGLLTIIFSIILFTIILL